MVVKDVNKKDINNVLLRFYRKEKYCANLQLNVFYNMSIMGNNINSLADSTKTRLSNILTKQKQIANVKHLLYGKIYDLYDEAMAAINNYNDAVARKDYLIDRKNNLDNLIHQQEQRRDSELNTYNTYVNTYIPNKQTEISNKQAAITAKQQQLDTTQAELDRLDNFIDFWETYYNRLQGYRDGVSGSDFNHLNDSNWYYLLYTASQYIVNLNMPNSIAEYFDTNNIWPSFPACIPSSNGHYTAKEMYTQNPARIYYKILTTSVTATYSLKMGDTQLIFNQTVSNATQAGNKLCEYFYSILDPMLSALQTYKPSDASLRALRDQYAAELATLQSELATLQAQLTQLEAERDYHWNEYQDALNQIASLRKEKDLINDQISTVEKSIDDIYKPTAERKSTIYNDAVERLPEKDREEYQDLPEPWDECHTIPDDDE